jgi:hypothetical protein
MSLYDHVVNAPRVASRQASRRIPTAIPNGTGHDGYSPNRHDVTRPGETDVDQPVLIAPKGTVVRTTDVSPGSLTELSHY